MNGGTVHIQYNSNTPHFTLVATQAVSISAGAVLSAKGLGNSVAESGVSTLPYSGAGHGGNGGGSNPGEAYDSFTDPQELGKAGGNDVAGGGVIRIQAPILTVDGTIDASGNDCSSNCGGGAGGSVYLKVDTLSGTGTIMANGGSGPASTNGGGGGGIVSIDCAISFSFGGSISAYGGLGGEPGGAGIIYLKNSSAGVVIVNNNNRNITTEEPVGTSSSGVTPLIQSVTVEELRVLNGAKVYVNSETVVTDTFTVGANASTSFALTAGYTVNNLVIHGNAHVPTTPDPSFYTSKLITTAGSVLSGDTVTFVCDNCMLGGDVGLIGTITVNPNVNFSMSGTWSVPYASITGVGGVATISGDLTVTLSLAVDNFEEVYINSNLTGPSAVLGATVSIYHNSASILDFSSTTFNSPNVYVYGKLISSSSIELNGRNGDSIQIFGSVNTPHLLVWQVVAAELGGSINVDTFEIGNTVRDVIVSGNFNVSNNAVLTMNYQSISITPTATLTTPTSLNLTSSSLSVFGRIHVPTLAINGNGDLTMMGFTTSATSPVIFSSGSIYMNNSMQLDVTSLNITCLGSTTFGGIINTTNLRHSLSGNVIIDGTLRVGTNVSFASSTRNISISSTGLLTAPAASLNGNYVNIGGAVDTTSFLVTAPAIDVAGASVSASSLRFESTGSLVVSQTSLIKATTMDFNVSGFSLDSSSSISVDGTVTENPAAYYLTVCPGGSYGGGGGGADLTAYGSIFIPIDKGTPGCSSAPYNGGAAGGTIKISVKNSCEINGKISANGSSRDTGGSGGSIWISSGQLSGTGGIYAHGGDSVADGAGGGGGGRIAIYSSLSFLGTIAAYGGKATSAYHGGPGTIYTEDSVSSFNSLVINNGNGSLVRNGTRAYVIDNLASFRFSEVAIRGGAELEFSGLNTASIVISTLSGDLTGNLVVVLNTQTFNISNLTSSVAIPTPSGFGILSSSITINSGTVNLPSSFVIPSPVILEVRRTICGVSKMMILEGGACRLSAGASSCQMGLGIFTFDVIVQSNGTLASTNTAIPTVRGQVCAMRGSVIQYINATQLWQQDTSSLDGPCVDYIPTTTSSTTSTTSTTSSTSSTSSTTSSTTSATTSTTSSTTSTSTTGTSTSTTGTPIVLPGIVQTSVNASRRFVVTTWTAPTNPSGLALTYTLEVVNITSGAWRLVYQGPNLNANATNLEPNTTHTFRIWASTSAGNGESRNFTATTKQLDPPSVSLAPTYRAYGKDYIVTLIQYPLDDGGLPVLNYTLYFSLDNSSWTVFSVVAPNNLYRFSSLNPTTKHYFKSYSTNSLGRSIESPVGTISTEASICGDGTCDPNESCASCSTDCRACQYPACPGTPECSSQGTCNEGVCNCNKDFSGPDCSIPVDKVPPVDVTPNATAPSIIITPNTKGNNNNTTSSSTTGTSGNDVDISVSFNILFDYIAEVNELGNLVAKESMLDRNFTISTQKLNLTDGSSVDQLKYTMKFNNGGSASVYLAIFKSASTILFANKTLNIPVNGVKYSMSIDNWNFASFRNKLQIAIKTDALSPSGSECAETQSSSDTQGNLRWIQVSLNGVILYGTFEEVALVDGSVRSVQYKYDGDQRTIISVPHFWFNAEFDPDFQVLLDPNGQSKTECGDNNNSKKGGVSKYLLIGVVAGAIAAIIAASIVGAIIMNKRKKQRERRMSSRGSTMMKPVNSTTSTLSSSSSSAPPSPSPSRSEKVNLV